MCQRKCEERALLRAYEHGAVAVLVAAGIKRHEDQLLRLEPVHGLAAQLVELVAVHIRKALLVGRLVVCDAHAVRLAAAHVILCKVDGCAVLAAYNVSFLDLALARYIEYNVVHVGMFRTEYHVVQFRLAGGNKYALAVLDDIGQFIGKGEFGEQ